MLICLSYSPEPRDRSRKRPMLPRIDYAWHSVQLKANEPSVDMWS